MAARVMKCRAVVFVLRNTHNCVGVCSNAKEVDAGQHKNACMGGDAVPRIQVILTEGEQQRFDAYCKATGHKKSTLAARLIRDHLDEVGFAYQPQLFNADRAAVLPRHRSKKNRGGS